MIDVRSVASDGAKDSRLDIDVSMGVRGVASLVTSGRYEIFDSVDLIVLELGSRPDEAAIPALDGSRVDVEASSLFDGGAKKDCCSLLR